MEKQKLEELNVAILYNCRGNDADDAAAKDLLFDRNRYHVNPQSAVYFENITTDRGTKKVQKIVGRIIDVVSDAEDNKFFSFLVPAWKKEFVESIPEPIIVCKVRIEHVPFADPVIDCSTVNEFPETGEYGVAYFAKDTERYYEWVNGGYVDYVRAVSPSYTLYNYSDYMEEEKHRLERKVFRKGSVFPKNTNKGLSSTIQERQEQAAQYTPVETRSAEQELEAKMAEEKAKLLQQQKPVFGTCPVIHPTLDEKKIGLIPNITFSL